MAWEGKAISRASPRSLNPLNHEGAVFFLGALCYKGITTVWKINKLHHAQHLTENTGWQAETWESWVSYRVVLWCGTSHCAVTVPIRLPALHRQALSFIKRAYCTEHTAALVSPEASRCSCNTHNNNLQFNLLWWEVSWKIFSMCLCVCKSDWHERMPQNIL